MRKIHKYITMDGKEFETREAANRYAEQRYVTLLGRLAYKVAHVQNYREAEWFLKENMEVIALLRDLRADTQLQDDEERQHDD